ncbi:unnamed protein product [Symbiodinium natans]|uniref:Uncharacterized protein n=1 Tax=Symbiodinium natans TaxID=878477 RepID=A0A812LWF8_9DINO|nr:unnamed protein product [Symbiodinium natans]
MAESNDDVPMCHCNRKNDAGNRGADCPAQSGDWKCAAQKKATGLCPDNRCTCVNSLTAQAIASKKSEAEVQRMFEETFSPFFVSWEMLAGRKQAGFGSHLME